MLAAVGGGSAVAGGAIVASTAATVGGAVMSASAARKQGQAANAQAQFEAGQMTEQAQVAGYNAKNEFLNAEREISDLRDLRTRNLAAQQADLAGSGIRISGSAIDVMRDTTLQTEKAIARVRLQAQQGAYNYGTQSKSLLTSATFTRTAGANAVKSSKWAAAAELLNGAARAGSNYFSAYSATHA